MGRIILEEQAAPSTPAADKIAFYPKAGGGIYKKNDAGEEKRLVEAGADSLITSMANLDDDGIPLAKVANAASDQADSTIVSINLTGGQIAFPGTAVPSADVNTLDDYEEGTWTPDLQFGGAKVDIVYGIQAGTYTVCGNRLFFSSRITLTSKGSSTGNAQIHGLPVLVGSGDGANNKFSAYISSITFANALSCHSATETTHIHLREVSEAGVVSSLTDENFANNSTIYIAGSYKI